MLLQRSKQVVNQHAAVVLLSLQELLALPKPDANSRAATLLQRWHFPNTYTLVRNLAYHARSHAHNTVQLNPAE